MNEDRDRQILRQAGLSHAAVAKYLDKTRQAVGYGLATNKDWLTYERSECIARGLKSDIENDAKKVDPSQLRRFLLALESHGKHFAKGLNAIVEAGTDTRLELGSNPFEHFKREAWIFSNQPAELERGDFLKHMLNEHFSHEDRRFVYFLAPGQSADQLASILGHSLKRLTRSGARVANVSVVVTNAMVLVPHTVIFDATVKNEKKEPRGYALGKAMFWEGDEPSSEHFFYEIPHDTVLTMINGVRTAGIGISDDAFFPDDAVLDSPIQGTKDTTYRILFSTELGD